MNALFKSHRHFRIWKYRVSHGQLLLRSVPTDTEHSRVEVLFRSVVAIKTTMELDSLKIRRPSEAELLEISQQAGIPVQKIDAMTFIIETKTSTGYLIAHDFTTAEDEGDYKTPSSLFI